MPSLRPASAVNVSRSLSRSCGFLVCTSDARTGSVGARIAPSRIAAPKGIASSHTPTAVTMPTVRTMETTASITAGRKRRSKIESRSLSPTVNSEMRTATSAARCSHFAWSSGSSEMKPSQYGPRAMPSSRQTSVVVIGRRCTIGWASAITTSITPITRIQLSKEMVASFSAGSLEHSCRAACHVNASTLRELNGATPREFDRIVYLPEGWSELSPTVPNVRSHVSGLRRSRSTSIA